MFVCWFSFSLTKFDSSSQLINCILRNKMERRFNCLATKVEHRSESCVCGERSPQTLFTKIPFKSRLKMARNELQHSFAECQCELKFHESWTVLEMMKTSFNRLIAQVNKIDYEKDVSLSREKTQKHLFCMDGKKQQAMVCLHGQTWELHHVG